MSRYWNDGVCIFWLKQNVLSTCRLQELSSWCWERRFPGTAACCQHFPYCCQIASADHSEKPSLANPAQLGPLFGPRQWADYRTWSLFLCSARQSRHRPFSLLAHPSDQFTTTALLLRLLSEKHQGKTAHRESQNTRRNWWTRALRSLQISKQPQYLKLP